MVDANRWRWWGGRARALALVLAALSGAAHAQFANRSIGFSGGYIQLNEPVIDRAVPLGLMGSLYLEDGWETTVRVHAMIVTLNGNGPQAFAANGGVGIRYLFLQELFRPYAGLELSYFQAFLESGGIIYVGASPAVGFDVMLGDQISLGPRGQVNFYWMINKSLNTAFEITLAGAAHF
jgi:outer membrane protein